MTAWTTVADGTRLWVEVTGSGSPVVLCHGGPGHLADVAELLDDVHTVVRFEQRGCGRSEGREGPFTLAQAADDLDQVRSGLGIERWGVLGHSWGAELAVRYAARYPARTTAVVYVAGIGAGDAFLEPYTAERDVRALALAALGEGGSPERHEQPGGAAQLDGPHDRGHGSGDQGSGSPWAQR